MHSWKSFSCFFSDASSPRESERSEEIVCSSASPKIPSFKNSETAWHRHVLWKSCCLEDTIAKHIFTWMTHLRFCWFSNCCYVILWDRKNIVFSILPWLTLLICIELLRFKKSYIWHSSGKLIFGQKSDCVQCILHCYRMRIHTQLATQVICHMLLQLWKIKMFQCSN